MLNNGCLEQCGLLFKTFKTNHHAVLPQRLFYIIPTIQYLVPYLPWSCLIKRLCKQGVHKLGTLEIVSQVQIPNLYYLPQFKIFKLQLKLHKLISWMKMILNILLRNQHQLLKILVKLRNQFKVSTVNVFSWLFEITNVAVVCKI